MSVELEREFTFLIHQLPADLSTFPSKIIEDVYLPATSPHPRLRIRRTDHTYVITKKYPERTHDHPAGDPSRMIEHTIALSVDEYEALNQLSGKRFKKRRFAYVANGYAAEVDVYLEDLAGLVVIDFEFDSDEAMAAFQKPDFVGADVTHDALLAGGMLCGKAYADIADPLLERYAYRPVKGVEAYGE